MRQGDNVSRRVIFLLPVLLLIFTSTLLAQEQLTQTFTSDDGLFSISYPANWVATEEEDLIRFSSDEAFIQINYRNYGEDVTALEILEIGALSALGFSQPENLDIAGYAAVLSRGTDQIHAVINLCAGNFALAIGYVQPGQVAALELTFMAMLQSLQYGDDGPQICRGAFENLTPIMLANAAQVSQLATFGDETVSVESLAFSPDGKTLAVGISNGDVKLWSLLTGEEQWTLSGHSGGATSVAFGSGGYVLAVGTGSGRVRLWDATTGEASGVKQEHDGAVSSVAFSPDGFLIASGGADGAVRFWDLIQGAEGTPLIDDSDTSPVESVAFTSDGASVAAGGGGIIRLWDLGTGTVQETLDAGIDGVSSVIISPDGTRIFHIGADPAVWVWDLSSDTHKLVDGHGEQTTAIALSADGQLMASADGGEVHLWNVETKESLAVLTHPSGQTVDVLGFSPDGTLLASAGESGGVILWGVPADSASSPENDAPIQSATAEGTESSATTCSVTAPNNANLRSGPGTNFDVSGSFTAGQTGEVTGQATGADGMIWYRLSEGSWIRSDIVGAPSECEGVPVVTP